MFEDRGCDAITRLLVVEMHMPIDNTLEKILLPLAVNLVEER
jgi:hypothetical protein